MIGRVAESTREEAGNAYGEEAPGRWTVLYSIVAQGRHIRESWLVRACQRARRLPGPGVGVQECGQSREGVGLKRLG